MSAEIIYYDLATDQAFRADNSAVANDNVPQIRFRQKSTIEWRFLNSQRLDANGDFDDFDTSLAAESVAASAAVDNDAYHYDDAAVSTAITGGAAITTVALKNVTASLLREAGRIQFTNSGGDSDILYYNGTSTSGATVTFTLSNSDYIVGAQTPVNSFAVDDDARIIQTPILKDAAVDVTDKATGKYLIALDADNIVYQTLVHGSKEISSTNLELTVKKLVGGDFEDVYVKEISVRCFYKLDDDGGVAPGAEGGPYTKGESDILLAAKLNKDFSGFAAKATPVDADLFALGDSAASFAPKKLSWADVKAKLKTALNPMTAANDLIVGGVGGEMGRLPVGTAGQALRINSLGDIEWGEAGVAVFSGLSDVALTSVAHGDLLIVGADLKIKNLGHGTANQLLTTMGAAMDPAWVTPEAAASTAEITAGTETGIRKYSPAQLKLAAETHGVDTKNILINGDFDIWQRGTSVAATTDNQFLADRWQVLMVGTTQAFSRQVFTLGQTAVPDNPKYYHRSVVASATAVGNNAIMRQLVEGVNTLSGQTATLSFWAKADASKNLSVEFAQNFGTGGTPSASVNEIGVTKVAITDEWQKITVTANIPSITGKTLGTNNNNRLEIILWFDAGSNYNARTDSLGHQSGTFDIAQVQLEAGSVATPFEQRPVGLELALCQRYCQKIPSTGEFSVIANGQCISSTQARFCVDLIQEMRGNPSMIVPNVSSLNMSLAGGANTALTALAMTNDGHSQKVRVVGTVSGGLAAGNATILILGQAVTTNALIFDAEL